MKTKKGVREAGRKGEGESCHFVWVFEAAVDLSRQYCLLNLFESFGGAISLLESISLGIFCVNIEERFPLLIAHFEGLAFLKYS